MNEDQTPRTPRARLADEYDAAASRRPGLSRTSGAAFALKDSSGQKLAYGYYEEESGEVLLVCYHVKVRERLAGFTSAANGIVGCGRQSR